MIKTYRVCPNCQSEECVGQNAAREAIAAGNSQVAIGFHCIDMEVKLMVDPAKCKLVVPAIILEWDVCEGCGLRRIVRVQTKNIPVDTIGVDNPNRAQRRGGPLRGG